MALADGAADEAGKAFDAALFADPDLVPALANRAVVLSLADYDRAASVPDLAEADREQIRARADECRALLT